MNIPGLRCRTSAPKGESSIGVGAEKEKVALGRGNWRIDWLGEGSVGGGSMGWAEKAEVDPNPVLTFLPHSALGFSKQPNSTPAGAAIVL